jgi:hypothetical protein
MSSRFNAESRKETDFGDRVHSHITGNLKTGRPPRKAWAEYRTFIQHWLFRPGKLA